MSFVGHGRPRRVWVLGVLLALLCSLSPDRCSANWALFRINLDGSGLEQITKPVDTFCGSPDWSPDGEWIAYDTWPTKDHYVESKVCLVRSTGGDSTVLGRGAMPSWSPDGTQIVCHTYDSPSTIVVMNADGSGRETVLNHWGSPRWSPKFDRIASLGSSLRAIHLLDLRSGAESVIFSGGPHANLGFSISPSGLHFCFGATEGGVAIASLDEESQEQEVQWLVHHGYTSTTSWSPDGKKVIYQWAKSSRDTAQLYVKDLTSDEPPQRLPWQDPKRSYASADWSPDGQSLVFCGLIEPVEP